MWVSQGAWTHSLLREIFLLLLLALLRKHTTFSNTRKRWLCIGCRWLLRLLCSWSYSAVAPSLCLISSMACSILTMPLSLLPSALFHPWLGSQSSDGWWRGLACQAFWSWSWRRWLLLAPFCQLSLVAAKRMRISSTTTISAFSLSVSDNLYGSWLNAQYLQ